MKRVINGKTYNTDTSTLIARYEYEDDKGYDTNADVYQSRGGAFFIVHSWSEETSDHYLTTLHMEYKEKLMKYYFEETTREDLDRLIAHQNNIEILDERALSFPPEAEAEAEPMATAYLRLPPALKHRIEAAAAEDKLSLNAWAIRCFERCTRPHLSPAKKAELDAFTSEGPAS